MTKIITLHKFQYSTRKRENFTLFLLILLSVSCTNQREFTAVKKLSDYKNTSFFPTLEQELSKNQNAIYCSTLLYAWDELRKQINAPIKIDEKYGNLILLNQSKTYLNTLSKDEYLVNAEIEKNEIKVFAEFDKNLPFEFDLQSFTNKLKFGGQQVASFGINGSDAYDVKKNVRIIYYKNDNNFIIKLLPKDKNHEIILFKSDKKFNNLIQMNLEIKRLIKVALPEKQNAKLYWKYMFNNDDELVIPKFNFNIETHFPQFEQKAFKTKDSEFVLEQVLQRTAFILDESGAKIESEATVETTTEEAIGEENIKKPKKMFFDKPFFLLMKKTNSENPYFAVWNANAELMVKE